MTQEHPQPSKRAQASGGRAQRTATATPTNDVDGVTAAILCDQVGAFCVSHLTGGEEVMIETPDGAYFLGEVYIQTNTAPTGAATTRLILAARADVF